MIPHEIFEGLPKLGWEIVHNSQDYIELRNIPETRTPRGRRVNPRQVVGRVTIKRENTVTFGEEIHTEFYITRPDGTLIDTRERFDKEVDREYDGNMVHLFCGILPGYLD